MLRVRIEKKFGSICSRSFKLRNDHISTLEKEKNIAYKNDSIIKWLWMAPCFSPTSLTSFALDSLGAFTHPVSALLCERFFITYLD